MEIQQETMGFDNGNSEEEAISNMTEDQCQQAISKLEYYTNCEIRRIRRGVAKTRLL